MRGRSLLLLSLLVSCTEPPPGDTHDDAGRCAQAGGDPGSTTVEFCNGVDDDCDGLVDDDDQVGPYDPAARYVKDEDGDGHPSSVVFACTPPGDGYVLEPHPKALDCAPTDPAVHPEQPDDCATQSDRNCDGMFRRVHVVGEVSSDVVDAFEQPSSSGPPVQVSLRGRGATLELCPGTYRVALSIVGGPSFPWPRTPAEFVVRGLGSGPSDVTLDAAGLEVVASIATDLGNLENLPVPTHVRFENLTLANGAAASGVAGCVLQYASVVEPADLTLERVIVRDCAAQRGAGVRVGEGNALTLVDVSFQNTHASIAGGAIDFAGRALRMSGGGVTASSAPSGAGSVLAAALQGEATLHLDMVDLDGTAGDIVVTFPSATATRDLGANATLHCDVASGCTP